MTMELNSNLISIDVHGFTKKFNKFSSIDTFRTFEILYFCLNIIFQYIL